MRPGVSYSVRAALRVFSVIRFPPVPLQCSCIEDKSLFRGRQTPPPAFAPGRFAPEAAPAETQQAAAPAATGGADGGGIAALLASADPAKGEKLAKRCAACHSFDNGGANKVGPNLWDIVGDHQGQGRNGYAFSSALSGLGGSWDYAALDAWLTSPKDYAPGNKMTFAGLKKPEDRADLIAWLRTLSDAPKPLP